jgi:uncharacterized protein YbjT (DUF2867 family)
MRILVTGGTGVVGVGAVEALRRRGHQVRILSRHADEDAKRWEGVEGTQGDVADPESLRGVASGCDAVLHVVGIVAEDPPAVTFQNVNVDGTRNILTEAYASGVQRFVHLSSLGAERGSSDYHRSKRQSEEVVRAIEGNWTIVRPGNVYGPGDEVVSLLLEMIRALPVVPMIGSGSDEFQTLWYEDLGEVLARIIERDDLGGHILEVSGTETTNMADLIEKLSALTDRSVVTVPVPAFLAKIAAKTADLAGIDVPIDEGKITMLQERIVIDQPQDNALLTLGVTPTPLADGLRKLIDVLPEQLPSDGVGALHEKRYWTDIADSAKSAEELATDFRLHCSEVMPIDFNAEEASGEPVHEGATLVASLPGRGHIQMRVIEAKERAVTFATVEGHPLAGTVRFSFRPLDERTTRFQVLVHARAARAVDWVGMNTIGLPLQDMNWMEVVRRVAERSGGTFGEVGHESTTLHGDDAEGVEQVIEDRVTSAARKQS